MRCAAGCEVFFFALSGLRERSDKLLEQDPDHRAELAGIKKFAPFGWLNSVNSLAFDRVTDWDLVMQLPTDTFFIKLYMNKVASSYQKNMNELLEKEYKSS